MVNKLLGIVAIGSLLTFCSLNANGILNETSETDIEIIETVKITPRKSYNPVEEIKNEIHGTKHWDENCSDHTIQISQADAERLMKIAYAEAGGEGIKGQLRVMQTVWNRVLSEDFPNNIKEVIEQTSQFSSVENGHYENAIPTWETHMALSLFEANNNHNSDLIGFETNNNGSVLLKYFDYYDVCGGHTFYKQKKD